MGRKSGGITGMTSRIISEGLVVALHESVNDLQALDGLGALLALAILDGILRALRQQPPGPCRQAGRARPRRPCPPREVVAVVHAHLAIQGLVGHELLRHDLQKRVERLGAQSLALVVFVIDGRRSQPRPLRAPCARRRRFRRRTRRLPERIPWTDGGWPRSAAIALGIEFFKVGGELVAQLFEHPHREPRYRPRSQCELAKYRTFSSSFGAMSSR